MPITMKAPRHVEPSGKSQRLVELVAQARLVEMAGQLVVIRDTLQPRLGLLAGGDDAQGAAHFDRRHLGVERGGGAVMHPDHAALVVAQPVFAVIARLAGEMVAQGLEADRQVFGMDPVVETVAGLDLFVGLAQQLLEAAAPDQGVAEDVPAIGDIPRGFHRPGDPIRFKGFCDRPPFPAPVVPA